MRWTYPWRRNSGWSDDEQSVQMNKRQLLPMIDVVGFALSGLICYVTLCYVMRKFTRESWRTGMSGVRGLRTELLLPFKVFHPAAAAQHNTTFSRCRVSVASRKWRAPAAWRAEIFFLASCFSLFASMSWTPIRDLATRSLVRLWIFHSSVRVSGTLGS